MSRQETVRLKFKFSDQLIRREEPARRGGEKGERATWEGRDRDEGDMREQETSGGTHG